MRIKQFAEKYNISSDTARFYEAEGLLNPIRLENGYRIYDENCERGIKFILVLKQAGFSLQEIKQLIILEQSPVSEECNLNTTNMFASKLQEIDRKINFYQTARQALQLTMGLMENGKYAQNEQVIEKLIDDMYENMV